MSDLVRHVAYILVALLNWTIAGLFAAEAQWGFAAIWFVTGYIWIAALWYRVQTCRIQQETDRSRSRRDHANLLTLDPRWGRWTDEARALMDAEAPVVHWGLPSGDPVSDACTCPDPYCLAHARCGSCGGDLIILPGDPAFCPSCGHDVMPAGACRIVRGESL